MQLLLSLLARLFGQIVQGRLFQFLTHRTLGALEHLLQCPAHLRGLRRERCGVKQISAVESRVDVRQRNRLGRTRQLRSAMRTLLAQQQPCAMQQLKHASNDDGIDVQLAGYLF